MAVALVSTEWGQATPIAGTTVTVELPVTFIGSDLPGGIGLDRDVVTVPSLDVSQTPALIAQAIAAAVRARATALGYSIGTNQVLIGQITKG